MGKTQTGFLSFQNFQSVKPADAPSGVAVASSSSRMVSAQTPPAALRGISSGVRSPVEHRPYGMKGVFVPTSLPYEGSNVARSRTAAMVDDRGETTENSSPIGGCMDTVDDKQVQRPDFFVLIFNWISISIFGHFFTGSWFPVEMFCLLFMGLNSEAFFWAGWGGGWGGSVELRFSIFMLLMFRIFSAEYMWKKMKENRKEDCAVVVFFIFFLSIIFLLNLDSSFCLVQA